MLDPSQFLKVDPYPVTPVTPAPSHADVDAGYGLWYSKPLLSTNQPGSKSIRARCSDCHAQDGRDLKYFGFSAHSIVERSKFHGMTDAEGIKAAIANVKRFHRRQAEKSWKFTGRDGETLGQIIRPYLMHVVRLRTNLKKTTARIDAGPVASVGVPQSRNMESGSGSTQTALTSRPRCDLHLPRATPPVP